MFGCEVFCTECRNLMLKQLLNVLVTLSEFGFLPIGNRNHLEQLFQSLLKRLILLEM